MTLIWEKCKAGIAHVSDGAQRIEHFGKWLATVSAVVLFGITVNDHKEKNVADARRDEQFMAQLVAFQGTASAMAGNTRELVSQTASMQEYAEQAKRQADEAQRQSRILLDKIKLDIIGKDLQTLSAASAALKAERYGWGLESAPRRVLDPAEVHSGASDMKFLTSYHGSLIRLCGVLSTEWQNLNLANVDADFTRYSAQKRMQWDLRYRSIAAVWPAGWVLMSSDIKQADLMFNTLQGAEDLCRIRLNEDVAFLEQWRGVLEEKRAVLMKRLRGEENE